MAGLVLNSGTRTLRSGKSRAGFRILRGKKMRDGIDVTRVLGGAQCKKDSVDDPVRVLIGHSCTARCRAREVSEEKAYAVEFNSAKWDDSNIKLSAKPE